MYHYNITRSVNSNSEKPLNLTSAHRHQETRKKGSVFHQGRRKRKRKRKSPCPRAQRVTSAHYSGHRRRGGTCRYCFWALSLITKTLRRRRAIALRLNCAALSRPLGKRAEQLSRNLTDMRVFSLTLYGQRQRGGIMVSISRSRCMWWGWFEVLSARCCSCFSSSSHYHTALRRTPLPRSV